MRMRWLGLAIGSLGLLLGAGPARAEVQRVCRDAGVTVSFTTGSVALDTNARGALDGVATWMRADAHRTLRLQGHADTAGNSQANLVLSASRADAVKKYLVSQGVDGAQVTTVGRGEEVETLPASARSVTFLACQAPGPPAAGETAAATETPTPLKPRSYPAGLVIPPEYTLGGFGWAVMAGGGYQDFTNSDMRDLTKGGGAWDVRFIGGTRSYLGFEGAYVGAARSIQTLGQTADNPTLVSNGVEGNLRINAPFTKGASLIEPYGIVGIGWSRYHISNFDSSSGALSSFNAANDDVMTVPLGLGFAYGYKALIVDVRGTWAATYYNNLLQASNGSGTLNTWGLGGQVGFAF